MSNMRRCLERQDREIKERRRRRAEEKRVQQEDEVVAIAMGLLEQSTQGGHRDSQVVHPFCVFTPMMEGQTDFFETDNLRPKLLISKQAIVNLGEEYLPSKFSSCLRLNYNFFDMNGAEVAGLGD
ncbi:unnamed protein product [Prunus armeniaca]